MKATNRSTRSMFLFKLVLLEDLKGDVSFLGLQPYLVFVFLMFF